jgi:hypothetical protein
LREDLRTAEQCAGHTTPRYLRAIVIWHFYAVIFDPDVYPLKWTFVSGRAPEHEVREEEEEAAPQAAPESKAASGSRRGGM